MKIFKNIILYLSLAAIAVILYFLSRSNYLLFHNIVESYSIIIAAGIFIVSWNTRNHSENNNLVFLGISYLFVGTIDFFHVLSYKGMNIFTDYSFYANQLWVGARMIESISILLFAIFTFKKIRISFPFVFVLYASATALFMLSVFEWKIFPVCFVEGMGQTQFKIISEYVICLILILTLLLIIKTRELYDRTLLYQISGSIIFTILSEFAFTLYTDNYGITNVIGHLFKVISFYLIYKSVIVNTLARPFDILYSELKETRNILQTAMDQSPVGIAIADAPGGNLHYVNKAALFIRGGSSEDVVNGVGLDQYVESWGIFDLEGVPLKTDEVPLARAVMFGETNSREFIVRRIGGDDRIVLANAAPVRNETGRVISGIVVFQDITERKQVEEKLRETSEYLENLFRYANAPIIVWDTDYRITKFNHAFERLTGRSYKEVIGNRLDILFPEKTKNESLDYIYQTAKGEKWEIVEIKIQNADGSVKTVLWNSANIYDSGNKKITATIAQGQDITERKIAEEKILVLLHEKEVILKEIHHRIKNNMNIIYGLLSLHAGNHEDSSAGGILLDAAGRVQSMSVLYDKLYRSEIDGAVSIQEYFPDLISGIMNIFPQKEAVQLITRIDDIVLSSKVLTPLGIILNEFITNSVKNAFHGRSDGTISITALKNGSTVSLIYEDNGTGLPESVTFENSTGFGMQLVGMLVKDINGHITIDRTEGTKFIIEFKIQHY